MLDPLYEYENRPYLNALAKKRRKAFRVLATEKFILHSWRLFFWVLLFFGLWMLNVPSFFGSIASIGATLVFLVGFVYFFKKDILSFRLPDSKGLDNKLEKHSALPQGQIALIEDRLANPKKHDTRDLWKNAQHESLISFKKLRAPRLNPFLTREDPSAVRYIAILLFISGLMVSGPHWKDKIYSGLIPFSPSYVVSQGKSTNIWIKPPDYTQIAQTHISGHGSHDEVLNIPEDSEIRIRMHSVFGEYFPPHLRNGDKTVKMEHMGDGLYGIETVIEPGKSLKISQAFIPRSRWDYNFIEDMPPEIRSDVDDAPSGDESTDVVRIDDELPPLPFDDAPSTENEVDEDNAAEDTPEAEEIVEITDEQRHEILDSNQIRFPLIVNDDYGVKELRMTMNIDEMVVERPLGEMTQETRLVMSQPNTEFSITPIYDMTWHTWAGLPVTFTYEAIDHKGQTAELKNIKLVLPEREFEHPMAKSLIAMRKRLAWDYKDSFREIAQNLETLLSAEDYMQNDPVTYLAIRVASSRLFYNDDMPTETRIQAAKDVINLLWYTALSLEEGDIALAMRELQDAQRALENAMRDPNASEEEIQELMNNLQEKMGNYFAEMQREMQKRIENGEDFPTYSAEDFGEIISPDTLSKMMEDIQQALREGDQQKAQELMSQMQRMMEMMDPSNGAQLPQDMQTMREGVNELQELIERQEALIDQTEEQAKKQKYFPQKNQSGSSSSQQQQQKESTMTKRSLPTLEQMLKDFGMDTAPPPPKDENKEEQNSQAGDEKKKDKDDKEQSFNQQKKAESEQQKPADNDADPQEQDKNGKSKEQENAQNKKGNQQEKDDSQQQQSSNNSGDQQKQDKNGKPQQQKDAQNKKDGQQGSESDQQGTSQSNKDQAKTQNGGSNNEDKSDDDKSANGALDTTKNKVEQDALRYTLGQLMMDAAEKLDEVPEKMGMAEQEMRGSGERLGDNDPTGSLPHQNKAVEYLKDAQEDLAQQFRQRMQQMIGIGMSGSSQKYDPLGRRYGDENEDGRGVDSKVEVPDELDKKRVDEIIKMLRDRSGDRSRSREELEYFRRLLRQF